MGEGALNDYQWDVVMERPFGFLIDDRQFYLYQTTLGKKILYERIARAIGLFNGNYEEAIATHRQDVCRIVAISTCNGYAEVCDEGLIAERQAEISKLDDRQLVSLLLLILPDRQDELSKALGIDRDQQQMERVQRLKDKDRNMISFGGVSIFGALIDAVCERYGWLPRQVVWEVGYDLLTLMMKDSVKSIYLTDKERKRIHISNDRTRISADDVRNLSKIQAMDWR